MKTPKVFISYSHDSDAHKDRVFDLSERLIEDGVDSQIDQYEISPLGGWPRWTRNQIKESDFVIVMGSAKYERRYEGTEEPGVGAGAKWEGAIITQQLYESDGAEHKFIPAVFSREDVKHIPLELRGSTYYVLDSDEGYEDLYRHITTQPKAVKGTLGRMRSLPAKQRKQNFHEETQRPAEPQTTKSQSRQSIVLLLKPDEQVFFVPFERIQASETITVTLVPRNSREASAVDGLNKYARGERLGLAYGSKALFAQLVSLTHIVEGGREAWMLELKPDADRLSGHGFEINISGATPEYVAELRARRILLNEKLFGSEGVYRGMMNNLNQQLLEHAVREPQVGPHISQSPLPALYVSLKDDPDEYISRARLYSVLLLILTNTVESIQLLDLKLNQQDELLVRFEGTRKRQYSNQSPPTISSKVSASSSKMSSK